MANIVRIERLELNMGTKTIVFLAKFDVPVKIIWGEAQDFHYCLEATDEISAYKEAMEYLNEIKKFK